MAGRGFEHPVMRWWAFTARRRRGKGRGFAAVYGTAPPQRRSPIKQSYPWDIDTRTT